MRFGCLITVLIIAIIGGFAYWNFFYTYSDGNRSGLLQKFSRRGNVFKTYEGELVLSSLINNNTSTLSAEKFFFSVADEAVAQKLMGMEGQRVLVHYEEKKGTLFWRGDSKYIVDSVRVIGRSGE